MKIEQADLTIRKLIRVEAINSVSLMTYECLLCGSYIEVLEEDTNT